MTQFEALTPLSIDRYSNNVKIFEYTLAIDVPNKLDAIAESFMEYNNNAIQQLTSHLNESTNKVYNYITNVVYPDIENFKSNIENNLSNFVGSSDSSYSITQVNSLIFSGSTNIEYDSDDRIILAIDGNKKISNIIYDEYDRIVKFDETISIDGLTFSKTFNIIYNGDIPQIMEEQI